MPPFKKRKITASTNACVLGERPPARVKIDADGDLFLQVGKNQCLTESKDRSEEHEHKYAVIYVVDSKAVSRSSPVWRKMLNGPFAESKRPDPDSGEEWTVELPDDDPTAILTIMNIIHNHFSQVPRGEDAMPTESLYQLTVLTDKYDLTHLLYPWADNWTTPLEDRLSYAIKDEKSAQIFPTLEMFLWISWELGNVQLFSRVYTHFVLNTAIEGGQLVEKDSGIRLFSSGILEPSDVSGKNISVHARFIISNRIPTRLYHSKPTRSHLCDT